MPLVAGCVSPDKGICHALLGIAAHSDPVSGNYIFTKLSICELCAVKIRGTRNTAFLSCPSLPRPEPRGSCPMHALDMWAQEG